MHVEPFHLDRQDAVDDFGAGDEWYGQYHADNSANDAAQEDAQQTDHRMDVDLIAHNQRQDHDTVEQLHEGDDAEHTE